MCGHVCLLFCLFEHFLWTQEAQQTRILENGTDAEGPDADGNAGDSTVKPPSLSFPIARSFHLCLFHPSLCSRPACFSDAFFLSFSPSSSNPQVIKSTFESLLPNPDHTLHSNVSLYVTGCSVLSGRYKHEFHRSCFKHQLKYNKLKCLQNNIQFKKWRNQLIMDPTSGPSLKRGEVFL